MHIQNSTHHPPPSFSLPPSLPLPLTLSLSQLPSYFPLTLFYLYLSCFFVFISSAHSYTNTQEYLPDLYQHFQANRIETHMYASQWFLTIYTAKFPLSIVFRILDIYLCEVTQSITS